MRVRFVAIGKALLPRIRVATDLLRQAVDTGDMDAVDAITADILRLIAGCSHADLSEEEWERFWHSVKALHPSARSDYLLPAAQCESLFPALEPGDYVLALPIDGATSNV